jgi:hypothetical protein
MIKLKSLLKEYISNPLADLKSYLTMTDNQKKEDLINRNPYFVKLWAEKYFDIQTKRFVKNSNLEDKEIIRLLKKEYPYEYIDFLDWSYNNIDKLLKPIDIPSWYVLEYDDIIKNQWLIQFRTIGIHDIWTTQKFTYGMTDIAKIAYSTSYSPEFKKGGLFGYAYTIEDFPKYARSSFKGGNLSYKYGKEALLFQASGLKVHHYGDQEPQVIFLNNTAKNIVYIKVLQEKDWGVINNTNNKIIYRAQILSDVVKWVINNFNQYKKVLLP